MKLKPKELEFLYAYIKHDFNAAAAYREVFPENSESTAKYAPYRILKRPHVKEALRGLVSEILGDQEVLANRALLKLEEIAFSDKRDEYYAAGAQLKAIELIQKQLGVQTQNIKADVKGETQVVINITGDDDAD